MPKKIELKYGSTPWDDMTKEQLLMEVRRMYSALTSANSVIRMHKSSEEYNGRTPGPYWGGEGTGGAALEKLRQIIQPIEDRYDQESIYRSFYRYADDLLFATEGFRIGFKWLTCDTCDQMFGSYDNPDRVHIGAACNDILPTGCSGHLRTMTWDDITPQAKAVK